MRIRLHRDHRPARGTACCSTTRRARPPVRLPRAPTHRRASRKSSCRVLPHGQEGHPAQRHPDAEHEGELLTPTGTRWRSTSTSASSACANARRARRRRLRPPPGAPSSNASSPTSSDRTQGMTARTCAPCGTAARLIDADFRRDPANRRCSCACCSKARRDPGNAADEPVRHPGLPTCRLAAHRRPDAARPVPCLHRGPAHLHGAAQRAPLDGRRARPRIPAHDASPPASRSPG